MSPAFAADGRFLDDRVIVNVSWKDAQAFAAWREYLIEKDGKALCPNSPLPRVGIGRIDERQFQVVFRVLRSPAFRAADMKVIG